MRVGSAQVEDVEMLESSFEAQLKAALYRIKQLEAKLGTAGAHCEQPCCCKQPG